MMVGVPLFLIEIVCFYGLLRYFFPPEVSTIPGGQEFIRGEIQKLGKMSRGEVNVLIVFAIMLFLFTMPAVVTLVVGGGHPVAQYLRGAVPIWVVPPLVLILLFLLPVNFEKGEGTLVWRDVAEHANWNIIFLVTGAVGMTEALAEFGFMEFIQGALEGFSLGSVTLPVVAAVVTAISTNIVSGTAAATLFASIFIPVADLDVIRVAGDQILGAESRQKLRKAAIIVVAITLGERQRPQTVHAAAAIGAVVWTFIQRQKGIPSRAAAIAGSN